MYMKKSVLYVAKNVNFELFFWYVAIFYVTVVYLLFAYFLI